MVVVVVIIIIIIIIIIKGSVWSDAILVLCSWLQRKITRLLR